MDALERFTEDAALAYRDEIAASGGNEVFAVGKLDDSGRVRDLKAVARGNQRTVAALMKFVEGYDVVIHNHPSGGLEPSDADVDVSSSLGASGVGSYITDNEVDSVYVVAEPVRKRKLKRFDPDALAAVIESGGKLALSLPGYEPRPSQADLLRLVARAFNENSVCAAEAGTGVGKSIAYLIPAMSWAHANGERVVISTGTINLQHQLVEKDIPRVNMLLKSPVKAALVKGKANYLCRTRLRETIDEAGLFSDQLEQLEKIVDWSADSVTGQKADLSFLPDEAVWSKVCAEGDFCLNLKCRYRDGCFVLRMKREAADAKILVTNHHLLFSDLSARLSGAGFDGTAVLPPFTRIIFDEAHNIESSATSFFSKGLDRFSVLKQLGRLYREHRDRKFGSIIRVQNAAGVKKKIFSSLPLLIADVRERMDAADIGALGYLGDAFNARLVPPLDDRLLSRVVNPLGGLEASLAALLQELTSVLESLPETLDEDPAVFEAKAMVRRLAETATVCSLFQRVEGIPESVFWLERRKTSHGDPFVCFNVTPLNVSPMMREAVFEPYPTVACVSATLAVSGDFSFWASRSGLGGYTDKPVLSGIFPSPFPYRSHVLLGIPDDAPMPDAPEYRDYVNGAVGKILESSGGRALVLFTSYDALKSCHEAVKPKMDALGISVFRQGDDDRSRLLDSFKKDITSVLFATDSFWEGVDAPGETLQVVVIAKLPFHVPTDPVQKARAEAVEKGGGNPFMDMSLPEAVMKLKQGFGRLMRKCDDYGAVIILDPRVLRKRYGTMFLDSLPETRRSFKPLPGVLSDLEDFLYSRR